MATNGSLNRKLRMALVGGGRGSFMGRVHCIAALLDNRAELAAGVFSSDPRVARDSAGDYGIAPDRAYSSYQDTVYPNVYDGVEGMLFIQQSVASSTQNGAWQPLKYARSRI